MNERATKLQAAWLYAMYFAECERCAKSEELIVTRDFFMVAGGLKRWQKHHQDLLEDMIDAGTIIVERRGKGHRSQDFFRLDKNARKYLGGLFSALKKHSWVAGLQYELWVSPVSQLSDISASGE